MVRLVRPWVWFQRVATAAGTLGIVVALVVLMLPRSVTIDVHRGGTTFAISAALLGVAGISFAVAVVTTIARLLLRGSIRRPLRDVFAAGLGGVLLAMRLMPELVPFASAALALTMLLLANLGATRRIACEPHQDPLRARRQIILVWALPLFGALLVRSWYDALDFPPEPDDFPTNDSPGDGIGGS